MKLCFTCQTLDADFRMWNIKFSIIHIYKSGERIFNLKYRILCTSYENVWTQNFLQNNVEFFILELWKSGCRFFDKKFKKCISKSPIPTWSHETWNFFHICNLKTFVKSFLHEILNTNVWKTWVNFPTRNIEFAHRFHAWALIFSIFPSDKFELQPSDMRFEILSHIWQSGEKCSHKKYEFSNFHMWNTFHIHTQER